MAIPGFGPKAEQSTPTFQIESHRSDWLERFRADCLCPPNIKLSVLHRKAFPERNCKGHLG